MKITSPKDAVQLAIAKKLAYKEVHDKGKMLIGEFQGESVSSAKEKIQNALYQSGDAFPCSETERKVVSRRGDECVVTYSGSMVSQLWLRWPSLAREGNQVSVR